MWIEHDLSIHGRLLEITLTKQFSFHCNPTYLTNFYAGGVYPPTPSPWGKLRRDYPPDWDQFPTYRNFFFNISTFSSECTWSRCKIVRADCLSSYCGLFLIRTTSEIFRTDSKYFIVKKKIIFLIMYRKYFPSYFENRQFLH